MRFVLNTRSEDMVSRVCIHELQQRLVEQGVEAFLNDWERYDQYDVAIFRGYDHDMEGARRQNPRIRVGLADPKQSRPEWIQAAREADFLLVSSPEQRDAFLRLNRNILIHYMFPKLEARPKVHRNRESLVIGYHGNRVHLECMYGGLQLALNQLGRQQPIELVMVYNVAALGQASVGLPDARLVKLRHVQWSPNAYYDDLDKADIGIVPNLLPVRDKQRALEVSAFPQPEFCYEPFDHLLRLKASTNPGRIYPFARFGIPVVADFNVSAAQFIEDGVSGFLVSSPHGWLAALETLAASAALRNEMAGRLGRRMEQAYETQVPRLLDFCQSVSRRAVATIPEVPTSESEFALLGRYSKPRGPGALRMLVRRLMRATRGAQTAGPA